MSENESRAMCVGALFMLLACVLIGTALLVTVRSKDKHSWERDAIAHGAAEYVVAGDKIEFRWRMEK